MAINISDLLDKRNNAAQQAGTTNIPANQKLTAEEFQKLVRAVQENYSLIETIMSQLKNPVQVISQQAYEDLANKQDNVLYFITEEE